MANLKDLFVLLTKKHIWKKPRILFVFLLTELGSSSDLPLLDVCIFLDNQLPWLK